jgi:translation initiation factor 1
MVPLFDGTPWQRPVRCDRCGAVEDRCVCPPEAAAPKSAASLDLRVRRERRRGKWCTVVAGLCDDPAAQKELLKALRTGLGAGGGLSDGELVLQGDHREEVLRRLVGLGYRAKAAGG